ncbi:IMP dehydrogenase [Vibrio breoganii]|uniref:vWA domain-containing protein n=1 Tax=Vibrio breoganii TaxID=553239 RepID=UPI000C81A57E|nr:VWA domain-containing protein [Vibrio breoganii]PMG80529.1 IMP dehydrogenase [Vibrio breoganii]PMO35395.1 IMP dehydrogenase [Vibrio breoganii]PMO50889.1 IMP dehydrogenase [Vibrio breoganii]PMO68226.1 IMP dehydrogenase [Vibrio breoganii]
MSGFTFEWWWMLFALPLPYVAFRLLKEQRSSSLVVLPHVTQATVTRDKSEKIAKLFAILAWILLVIASARPVWYGDPIEIHPKHRDMMLVIDLSYSMSQEDMREGNDYIDRLTVVKQVVSDFVDKRSGDRLGLVYFADHAYLQTPLTFDRETVKTQLDQTVLKLIGTQTAIGDGIGLATKTFVDSDAPQRVMILLSDGSNNSGVLDPIQAAEIAKKFNTTIYTIGVGAGEMQVQNFFMTQTVNTAEDLDEKTLIKIADMTGGQYFRARDAKELATIYDTINALQPIQKATQSWRPRTEWFMWPAFIGLLLVVVTVMIRRNDV